MPPIHVETFVSLCLVEEGLIDLEVLFGDGLFRKEEFGSWCISVDDVFGEYFMDCDWTAVVLNGKGSTVE